jgi:hypothetical protein
MHAAERLRADLDAAMHGGGSGLAAADELCRACVELLGVDGAAISYVHGGTTSGTFGSSGELSRRVDEYQFTFGEGPCFDAVNTKHPVLVPDLGVSGQRWPAFTNAVLSDEIHAVFAAPVLIAQSPVGALDLFRLDPGPLTADGFEGLTHAARLAAFPLLDLMSADLPSPSVAGRGEAGPNDLASLERVEVYQATGMVMSQLDCGPADALARLRAHAFATNQTASDVAWAVVRRTLTFRDDSNGAGA